MGACVRLVGYQPAGDKPPRYGLPSVILAKAGIHLLRDHLDSGFRRSDGLCACVRLVGYQPAGDKPLVLPAAFSARKATLADPLQHGCAHFFRAHRAFAGHAPRQVRGAVSRRQHIFHGIFDCRRFLLQT